MMKEEFEQRIGTTVALELYEKVEEIYVAFKLFNDKDVIATFYKTFGSQGVNDLWQDFKNNEDIAQNYIKTMEQLTSTQAELKDKSIELAAAQEQVTALEKLQGDLRKQKLT